MSEPGEHSVFLTTHIADLLLPLCYCHSAQPRCSRPRLVERRPGLSARQPLFGGAGPSADDQLQISIESGTLDIDNEIDQLRSSVGRLKQVGGEQACGGL